MADSPYVEFLGLTCAIEHDKPRSVYCTQNGEVCASCSLSSYGRDCHGHAYATDDDDDPDDM